MDMTELKAYTERELDRYDHAGDGTNTEFTRQEKTMAALIKAV